MHYSNLLLQVLPCICLINRVAAATPSNTDLTQVQRNPRPRSWLYKRTDRVDKINAYVKQLSSILYALHLAQNAPDISQWCDPTNIPSFDAMGYDGDYVEAWVCAAAAGAVLFPSETLDNANANLVIANEGLKLARDDFDQPARASYCKFVSSGTLERAELNYKEIPQLICFPDLGNATTTATGTMLGTVTSSVSSSTTLTSGNVKVSATGSMTMPPCWTGHATSGGYGCSSGFNTTWTGPTATAGYGYSYGGRRHWK